MTLRNRIRIDRARDELLRLAGDIEAWIRRRKDLDKKGQYKTQLDVAGGVLTNALDLIRDAISALSDDAAVGDVYRACAAHERRVVVVHRLWLYLREKFDQRDDPQLSPTLFAADELAWSLYVQPFRVAKKTHGPQPLPYIEPYFTPRAIPRAEPPRDLRASDEILADVLKELPLPLIGLPPACVGSPSLLAYMAHEVGHHVQLELEPDWKLVGAFGDRLEAAAQGAGLSESDAAAWRRWSQEVFADAYSVAALGPWAVRSMAELETADERRMLEAEDARYPCPAVRLALMAAMAERLEVGEPSALGGVDPKALASGEPLLKGPLDLRAAAARHLQAVPVIAAEAMGSALVGGSTLADLAGFDAGEHGPNGSARAWAKLLLKDKPPSPDRTLRGARRVMGGLLVAWYGLAQPENEATWAASAERLRKNALSMLADSREPVTRAAAPARSPADLGAALAKRLLGMEPAELGV